jgi:hypothetical protein
MSRLLRASILAATIALGCSSSSNAPLDAGHGPVDGDASARDGDARDDAAPDRPEAMVAVATPPPNPCAPGAPWFDLPYTVASASYARGHGLIVARPETEHAIYLLDPDTCGATRVTVARPPLAIALSPDEATIAVGHDGLVSLVDLAAGAVRATVAIPAPATDVAFDARGRVVAFSHARAAVATEVYVVDPAAAAVASAGTLDGGGHLAATADGASLLWTTDDQTATDETARVVVGRAPLLGDPVVVAPPACHAVFPTDDSRALVTACGTVFGLAPADATKDLAPAGALAGVAHLQHADTLVAKGLIAVVAAADPAASAPPDGVVRVHAAADLSFVGAVPLPVLDTGQEHQTPRGRYVFLRRDGARAYVVARRQPGQSPVDGVAVIDPARAGLDAPADLKIAGSFPHRSGLPLPTTSTRLAAVTVPFRVIDAGYSRALDRLVMTSTRPADGVYLVDPATGAADPLPAPAAPSSVAVRADGLVAAVARAGGVTFFDLQQRTVLRAVDGPATSVTFGARSEVLLATDAASSAWLDLDTGALRAASSTAGETPGFTAVPGTSSFYSLRGRDLVRHDDTITAADPLFDLAPFVSPEAIVKPCATPFWVTDDGSHLVLDCARVFALSSDRARDLRYLGTLEAVSTLAHVAYAPSAHRFFSAPSVFIFSDGLATAIGRVAVHDDQSLDLVSSIDVGLFPGTAALSQPMRVFMGQTPERLLVVATSDTFGTPTHAIYTLDVSGL